jgi:FSR family fosmidomycin resistance protein-like MFS transporter
VALTALRSRLHPTVLLMACVHMMVDGYSNVLPPLLPLLRPKLGLTLAGAGLLTMVFQMAASVAQIGFGHLADRWRPRLLLMTGPVVAVSVLSLIGVATSFAMCAGILIVGGLGCAAFHPPGAALVHRLGGDHPGLSMSVYITGGTLGFAIGPLMFAPVGEQFGLGWTPLLALPGLAVVVLFLARVPQLELHRGPSGGLRALRPYAKPLTLLYTIVVLRTLTSLAIATFVPLMLTGRGLSAGIAAAVVSLYLVGSGVGGFFGGPLADRYGPRRVIAWSLVASTPVLFLATFLTGWPFAIALALGGLFLQSTLPVNVTFGQALAPVSAATVSSLMMGFAWGTGGFSVPLVGYIADRVGIEHTLMGLSFVPLVAALCVIPLPSGRTVARGSRPADPIAPETPA